MSELFFLKEGFYIFPHENIVFYTGLFGKKKKNFFILVFLRASQ